MDVVEAIESNGTCRYFKPDPVAPDVLRRVLGAARFAPSGGNRQPVSFVVVTERPLRERLAALYLPRWQAYVAAMGTGSVRVDALPRIVQDADRFARHLADVPALIVVCAALTTLLCADEPAVKALLDIPDDISTAATVALGWPARVFPKHLRRRPLEEIAFGEHYGGPLPGGSTNL